jgi:hypothetical protein
VITRDGLPVAFVDWETAGPVDTRWELAHPVWLNAQLHDDDVAERLGLPYAHTRARQVRLIVDGYRLATSERAGLIDVMIELAVRSAAQEAIDGGVTPESTRPAELSLLGSTPLQGHAVLWAITWRTRGAARMLRNRGVLGRALA